MNTQKLLEDAQAYGARSKENKDEYKEYANMIGSAKAIGFADGAKWHEEQMKPIIEALQISNNLLLRCHTLIDPEKNSVVAHNLHATISNNMEALKQIDSLT